MARRGLYSRARAAFALQAWCTRVAGGSSTHCFENCRTRRRKIDTRVIDGTTDSVIFYDPQTNAWHEAEPLPQPLEHGNAIVIDGELVVVQMFIDGAVSFCYFKGQGWGQLPEAIAQKIPPINRNMRINNLGSVLVG